MAKLKQGDTLANLSAAEFNRHVDVADWYFRRKAQGERLASNLRATALATDRVDVRLDSETNLPRGSVVGLGDFVLDPDELKEGYAWFELAAVDLDQPWGILRRATPQNGIDQAFVAGACIARVDVLSTDHRFARPIAGETVLDSSPSGPVRLLIVPEATGVQELIVELGHSEGILTGVLTAALLQGASAPVDEIDLDADDELVYTGRSFTVWDLKLNAGESIDAGVKIDFGPMSGGRYKWITAHCEVSDTLPEEEE